MLQVPARLLELLLVINDRVEAGFVLADVVLMLEMQVFVAADDVLVNSVRNGGRRSGYRSVCAGSPYLE